MNLLPVASGAPWGAEDGLSLSLRVSCTARVFVSRPQCSPNQKASAPGCGTGSVQSSSRNQLWGCSPAWFIVLTGWGRMEKVKGSPPCSRATVNLGVVNTTPLFFQIILFQAASPSKILFEWAPLPRHQGKIWRFFAKFSLPTGSSCEILILTWFWMCFLK